MSDLPDLDTANISFCAFWNAIDDGGVSEIDPEDGLTDGNIGEYTLYDNGWEADIYHTAVGRDIKIRAKTDGWFVAYMGTGSNHLTESRGHDDIHGEIDLISGWTDVTSLNSSVQNTLERSIRSVASEFSDWDTMTYNSADVGLFSFEYPNATATTVLSSSDDIRDDKTYNYGSLFTDGTEINHSSVVGAGWVDDIVSTSDGGLVNIEFEGLTLTDQSGSGSEYGSGDVTNTLSSANTEYQFNVTVQEGNDNRVYHSLSNLTVWT